MTGLVALEVLHASDAAGPRGKPRGRLTGASAVFGDGVYAVLGAPEDGTLALANVLSGARKPTRGRVIVAGRDLTKLGVSRARIGALDVEPRLPPAALVADAVRAALVARSDPRAFDAILDPLGLSSLHARRAASLSFAEARAVELALALSTPAPVLVSLHEPFSDVALADPHVVNQRARDLAAAGACVVITTASAADAAAVADRVFVLRGGAFAFDVAAGAALGDRGALAEIVAWVTAGDAGADVAQAFRSALAGADGVLGVAWDDAGDGALTVRVRARDGASGARALVDAALASGVDLEGFAPTSPSLASVRAAADAMLRARFLRARSPAPRPPTTVEAPPPAPPPRDAPPPPADAPATPAAEAP
ncbi:MAG TPA: ATP-binding cassette domain-containing protein [Byssovorax sp.]